MEVKVNKMGQARQHYGPLYRALTFENNTLLTAGSDGILAHWSDINVQPTAFARTDEQIFALAFSKENSQVAVGTMPGHLHVLNTQTKEEKHFIKYKKSAIYDIAYLGEFALTAHANGEIALWNADTWQLLNQCKIGFTAVRTILPLSHGYFLYAGDSDGFISYLEMESATLRVINRIKAHDLSVFTLMSAKDDLLVSAGRDATLSLWDTSEPSSPVLLHKIPAHLATINHLIDLNPLPLWASASRDKSVKIWEAPTGKLLKVLDNTKLEGHINSVNRLLWQPEHNYLFSCGDDAALIQWHIDLRV